MLLPPCTISCIQELRDEGGRIAPTPTHTHQRGEGGQGEVGPVYLELLCCPQNQQLLGERGEEHSPLERDSLMPSDEASESSRQAWTGSSQRSSRHLEEDYADAYQDLYQPHRQHTSGLPSANGHDPQDRLLAQDSEHNHNDRNWQRNRPWPKDSY